MPVLYEKDIPQEMRTTVVLLIRQATKSCALRKTFYAMANSQGMLAAVQWLASRPGLTAEQEQSRMLLQSELESL